MSGPKNLVLEHLLAIRTDIAIVREDQTEMVGGLRSLKAHMAGFMQNAVKSGRRYCIDPPAPRLGP